MIFLSADLKDHDTTITIKRNNAGRKLTIHTPLINLTKAEIVKHGTGLGVDYSLTLTCYEPSKNGAACGECDSCILRAKGFAEAGVKDPKIYQSQAAAT